MTDLAALLPHAGTMVLLDRLVDWDAQGIECRTSCHLRPDNPLRRDGRLAACCGIEVGLQAAALHGALRGGGVAQPPGYVAALRSVSLHAEWLDDPSLGELVVTAWVEAQERFGMVYALDLRAANGAKLVAGRASIALPR